MGRWGWALAGIMVLAALLWALWPSAPDPRGSARAPRPAPSVPYAAAEPAPLPGLGEEPARPPVVALDAGQAPALDAGAPVLPAAPPRGGGYRLGRARGPRPRNVYAPGLGLDAEPVDAVGADAGAPDVHPPDAAARDGGPVDGGPVDGGPLDGDPPTDAALRFD